jgi:preprotein translocase subunit SecA
VANCGDAELANLTGTLRQRLAGGESFDDVLPEAFAAVSEAGRRTVATPDSEEQLIAGAALASGAVVDMKDGEGKSLAATLTAYLHALSGRGVHMATLDDYVARRDAARAAAVFGPLGVRVGFVVAGSTAVERKQAYAADVTYGSYRQLGVDYLRDNMAGSVDERVQRGFHAAIVDEADTVLIDNARLAWALTREENPEPDLYRKLAGLAAELQRGTHYETGEHSSRVSLRSDGIRRAEAVLGIGDLAGPAHLSLVRRLENALWVKEHVRRGEHYDVTAGRVVVGSQHTHMLRGLGRVPGLRQAIEARDGLPVTAELVTIARVLARDYFRMYDSLAGMSATALPAAEEFAEVYGLAVTSVPRRAPSSRVDHGDIVFRTSRARVDALVKETLRRHAAGQPVVIGAGSGETQRQIAWMLGEAGIAYAMVRAGEDEDLAGVMAQAGRPGAVTVIGESAARGYGICLGGEGGSLSARDEVIRSGGLAVLGSGLSLSRRADDWLRGLAGQRGEPGESQFFCSLEDPVTSGLDSSMNKHLRFPIVSGKGPAGRLETRLTEGAQREAEARAAKERGRIRQVEAALDRQRRQIYAERRALLEASDLEEQLRHLIGHVIPDAIASAGGPEVASAAPGQGRPVGSAAADEALGSRGDGAASQSRGLDRGHVLAVIDRRWQEQIAEMDALLDRIILDWRDLIDPLAEFQHAAAELYAAMLARLRTELAGLLTSAEADDSRLPRR